ncbi:hypothetical protein RM844_30460 [Streptomyces sp. DSM 44915]|uniref:Uncharacterized protein n=1 Tax=Streptomyces chisholmiae TaxID=3075540 RepID=A0ABU2K1G7_9ACTN|nr:hypothetical protein [Streptomyces sp. DSM 44915]MDT0270604.1 hypothetical protein [Streptomyces sp. DSM 44915]
MSDRYSSIGEAIAAAMAHNARMAAKAATAPTVAPHGDPDGPPALRVDADATEGENDAQVDAQRRCTGECDRTSGAFHHRADCATPAP